MDADALLHKWIAARVAASAAAAIGFFGLDRDDRGRDRVNNAIGRASRALTRRASVVPMFFSDLGRASLSFNHIDPRW